MSGTGKKKTASKKKAPKKAEPAKTQPAPSQSVNLEPDLAEEFKELFSRIDKEHHEYLTSVIKNPIMQFQGSTVSEYLKLVEENGLPRAAAIALDSRDYSKGNAWEQAQMNVMNAILPQNRDLKPLIKKAVEDGSTRAVKWYPEVCGNPQEIVEVLKPVLSAPEPKRRFWAAIHLSKHYREAGDLVPVLIEGLSTDWVAFKQENSSTGITGRGECARALARLGKKGEPARAELEKQLKSPTIDAADASEIAGALYQLTQDAEPVLRDLAVVAERVLTQKRGFTLHSGDRDMLMSLKNLIKTWREAGKCGDESLEQKIALLESEIKYHFPS